MSSWGNNDNAANAPYWAVNSTIAPDNPNRARPTAANVALLYGNTTSGVYTTGKTVGLFLVDTAEEIVSETQTNHPVHTGWNLKVTGSGGRAGRTQWETLVSLASVQSDNSGDDATIPDAIITITQPIARNPVPVSAASGNTVTFSVLGTTAVPDTAVLTYKWQVNAGGMSWVDIDNGTNISTGQPGNMIKTGANTATLILDPTSTGANNYVFRAKVTATNPGIAGSGAVAYSSNAKIIIVA
jgi:hypothetical protein